MVKDFEVAQLLDSKIDIENQEFRPKLAFIVVQKRINTRFLAVEVAVVGCGVVGCGMVWYGVVWYGMVWL